MPRKLLNRTTACTIAALLVLQPAVGFGQVTPALVTAGPQTVASGFAGEVQERFNDPAKDPSVTQAQLVAALRQRVKYVFVIFQENRSFDHYFGTFPGANGLFAEAGPNVAVRAVPLPSNTQPIYDTDGKLVTVSPFRIGTEQNAADLDDIDHGHARMVAKMNVPQQTGAPAMDRFALNEQAKYFPASPIGPGTDQVPGAPSLRSKQYGELSMAYVDCDTVPFMWDYANRFTLFDNIFQTTIGPSTPNAIAMIAGQVGETQWVKHPDQTSAKGFGSVGVPITNDPLPGLPATAPDLRKLAAELHGQDGEGGDSKRHQPGRRPAGRPGRHRLFVFAWRFSAGLGLVSERL